MRPRTQFLAFRPPVSLADLEGQMPRSGYLLVTEPESDEVASATTKGLNLARSRSSAVCSTQTCASMPQITVCRPTPSA